MNSISNQYIQAEYSVKIMRGFVSFDLKAQVEVNLSMLNEV